MIVHLLAEQTPDYWELIKYTKAESDPMKSSYMPDRMNRLLNAVLVGSVDVWIILNKEQIVGCILTTFYSDPVNGTQDLCIYGFASAPDRTIPPLIYGEMFSTITKYAKKHRCTQIVAYTDNEFLTNMAMNTTKGSKKDFITFNIIEDWEQSELTDLKS